MSKITLPAEDIVALSGNEKNNILYEWISKMPIQEGSQFAIYCPDKLQDYLQAQGMSSKTHRIRNITDYFWLDSKDVMREIALGFCFILTYDLETAVDNDQWASLHVYFYKDGHVEMGYMSDDIPEAAEKEILKIFKKYGFKQNARISWTKAYAMVTKINGSSIPPVPLE